MVKRVAFRNPEYLSVLCTQLYLAQRSGMPMKDTFEMLAEGSAAGHTKDVYKEVVEKIGQGACLENALGDTGEFPDYLLNMVAIGEETGRLEETFYGLSNHYRRESEVKESVTDATVCPLVMGVIWVVVMLVLSVFVLPLFCDAMQQMGMEPVKMNRLLNFGLALVGALVVSVCLVGLRLRVALDCQPFTIISKTELSQSIGLSQFISMAAMMMASGLGGHEILERAMKDLRNPFVQLKVENALNKMNQGKSFVEALGEAEMLDQYLFGVLWFAERNGNLAEALEEAAGRKNAELTKSIDTIVAAIEPTAVVMLSVLAGVMMLSVMLPLLGALSSIG